MYKGLNCDRKSQLSEILTEPSNPRVASIQIQKVAIYKSDRKIIKLISNKSFRYYKL